MSGALALLLACGDDADAGSSGLADAGNQPDAAQDASTSDSGEPADAAQADASGPAFEGECTLDAQDAGAECNELENVGTNVTITAATGAMDEGSGGTFANGTYVLSEVLAYPGSTLPTGIEIRQTLVICDGIGELSEQIANSPVANHKSFTFEPAGTVPNAHMTCSTISDDEDVPYTSYTATATSFTLYNATDAFQMTFTKQ